MRTASTSTSQLINECNLTRDWLRETGGDETVWSLTKDSLDLAHGIESEKATYKHVAASLEFTTQIGEDGIRCMLSCSDGIYDGCPHCYIRFPEAVEYIITRVHEQHGIGGRLERRGTHEIMVLWHDPTQVSPL